MVWFCLLPILPAAVLGWLLSRLCRDWAGRLGQLDHPGDHKGHARPVPAAGGMAIFAAVALTVGTGIAAAWLVPADFWSRALPAVARHLEGIRQRTPMAATLFAAAAGVHLLGLVDDRRPVGPILKLAVEAAAVSVLVFGFDVRLLVLLGPVGSGALTLFWLLTVTNAFNFLDNMDGLSAGVATVCGAMLAAIALLSGQWFVAALLISLTGALLGFLRFNLPPASLFMGDSGSLVVGFLLAFCSVRVTYFDPAAPDAALSPATAWHAVLAPLVVLAIPLYDLLSVTAIRLAQGRNPLVGDRQHFSHRLVQRGLTEPAAITVVWGCTLAAGLGGVLLGRIQDWQAAMVVAQTAVILLVLALLEWSGRPR